MLYTEHEINLAVEEIMNSDQFINDTKDMNDPFNIDLMCYVGLIGPGEFPEKIGFTKKEIVKMGLKKYIREQEMIAARDIPSNPERRRRLW